MHRQSSFDLVTAVSMLSTKGEGARNQRRDCLQEAVEDTTGAGDAFIGTILYSIIHSLPHEKMLQLAAVVASCKCTALGARPGLPHAEDIDIDMLTA